MQSAHLDERGCSAHERREGSRKVAATPVGGRHGADRFVLREDRRLQLAKLRTGLEPELLRQHASCFVKGVERGGLAAAPIQRKHQLAPQALAKRVIGRRGADLREDLGVVAQCQRGVESVLQGVDAERFEASRLGTSPSRVEEAGQRRPAPQAQRLIDHLDRSARHRAAQRSAGSIEPFGEHQRVDDSAGQRVAVSRRDDRGGSEHLAQPRHVVLQRIAGVTGSVCAPQRIGQRVHGDDATRVQRQEGDDLTALGPARIDTGSPDQHLERAQHPDFERGTRRPLAAFRSVDAHPGLGGEGRRCLPDRVGRPAEDSSSATGASDADEIGHRRAQPVISRRRGRARRSIGGGSDAEGGDRSANASPSPGARPRAKRPRAAAPSAVPSASPMAWSGRSSVAAITSRHSGERNAPPVTRTDCTGREPVELVQDDPQLHADALDRRAHEVAARMVSTQPEIGAGHVGVPERRALGEQVRQHDEPIAAGVDARCEVQHRFVRGAGIRGRGDVRGKRVPGPADDDAPVADRPADDPHRVRQGVTEQRPLVVDVRVRDGHSDGAARTQRQPGDARRDRARAEVSQRAVGGPDDHWRARRQRRPVRPPPPRAAALRWWAGSAAAARRRPRQPSSRPGSTRAPPCRAGRCPRPRTAR